MKKHWRSGSAARPLSGSSGTGARLNKPSPHSVRGRISNPIPVVDPADEEFPMRQPVTDVPIAKAEEVDDVAVEESHPSDVADLVDLRPSTPNQPIETEPAVGPESVGVATSEARSSPVVQRTPEPKPNHSSTLRQSMISSDTARTRSTKDKHEKKKSGLRGALGKLFGRKKKTDSVLVSSTTPGPSGPDDDQLETHHSHTATLRKAPSNSEPKRSVSLPITEFDRALRSHSIGPDDVLAIDSARNSATFDNILGRRRLGAASTHLVGVRPSRDQARAGLTPRPASTHGMRNTDMVTDRDDPSEIGRALTSDFTGLKRRSRSLSFLANVPAEEEDRQRQSHELRYWRESYEPHLMSPISSSNAEDTETAPMSMELARNVGEMPAETPPQPFHFGDIATMNEMAGMRITDAVSMDSRISSLEARLHRIEGVMTQLCDATPNFKPRFDTAARHPAHGERRGSNYGLGINSTKPSTFSMNGRDAKISSRPSTQQSLVSKTSFGDSHTFVGSAPRSFAQPQVTAAKKERPVSGATIRGATSLPSLNKDANKTFTIDHYTALMAHIQTERSARQALESQVKVLNHQLTILSKTVRKRNGRTNSTASGIQKSSFDVDEDDDEEEQQLAALLSRQRSASMATHEDDDVEDSDDFTTPHENGQTFEEQLAEGQEEEQRRQAARTMSLSRLTLGGPPIKQ